MPDRNDLYTLLGVGRDATTAEIRRRFQKLARRHHPDLNPGDNVAAVRYQRIHEAYEVLADPEKRERYDTLGTRPPSKERPEPARYGFEGFDFSLEERRETNIFPDLFRRRATEAPLQREDGEDIHHRLSISFEESLAGFETVLRIKRSVTCPTCEGWREIPSRQPKPCIACDGRGRATQTHGFMLFARPCSVCRGKGVVASARCPDCLGAGGVEESRDVEVQIPAGVADGDKLSVPGMGHQGRGSGRTGDLYIHVSVQPHSFFTRKGDNLFCTVPVTFREAALGERVEVPTPTGVVTLRLPAGVQSGQKLRLSERGAPSRLGAARGDLFVEVKVVTPHVYDDRSRDLLRELDRLNPSNPRENLWRPQEKLEGVSK